MLNRTIDLQFEQQISLSTDRWLSCKICTPRVMNSLHFKRRALFHMCETFLLRVSSCNIPNCVLTPLGPSCTRDEGQRSQTIVNVYVYNPMKGALPQRFLLFRVTATVKSVRRFHFVISVATVNDREYRSLMSLAVCRCSSFIRPSCEFYRADLTSMRGRLANAGSKDEVINQI